MMSSRAVPILIMVVGARGTYLHPAASFLRENSLKTMDSRAEGPALRNRVAGKESLDSLGLAPSYVSFHPVYKHLLLLCSVHNP